MKTIATIRVEFDHADYAARFGIDLFDVPADVRALVEDVAAAFRDGGLIGWLSGREAQKLRWTHALRLPDSVA